MIRNTLVKKRMGAEAQFRWRGEEVSRIEGFSDAVFAFAVTLIVVSLEVPKTFEELRSTLFPNVLAFAICFLVLYFAWFYHYQFFRRYGLHDGLTLILNALLLFVVLVYVYPLKFLFSALVRLALGLSLTVETSRGVVPIIDLSKPDEGPILMMIYSMGYTCVFAIFALLYLRAYHKRHELALTALEIHVTRSVMIGHLLNIGIGVLSTLLALGGPGFVSLSGIVYILTFPIMYGHFGLARRHRRALQQKLLETVPKEEPSTEREQPVQQPVKEEQKQS